MVNWFEKLYDLIRKENISKKTILKNYDLIRAKSINLIFINPKIPSIYQGDTIINGLTQELEVIKIVSWLSRNNKKVKGFETKEDRIFSYMGLDMKAKDELRILYNKLRKSL